MSKIIYWNTVTHIGEYPYIFKKVFDKFYLSERKNYNSWIEKISSKFESDIDWIASPPISRNIYSSNLYKNICILKTLDILSKKYQIEILVCSDDFKKVINFYFSKISAKVNTYFNKNYILRYFYFIYIFRSILIFFIEHIIIKFFFSKKIKIKKNSTLIDTYIVDSKKKEKIYYGNIVNYSRIFKKKIFLIPTIIKSDFFNFISIVRSLKKDKNFIFKEQFLNFKDLIYCFMYIQRKKKFLLDYPLYDKFNLSILIINEIYKNRDLYSVFLSLYNFCFVKRLNEKKLHFRKIINWFENQSNGKSWNFAFRFFFKNTKIFGYQGFTHYPEYMNTMPTKYEEKLKIIPQKLIVINKNYNKFRREFFPDLKILNGPALRFSDIYSKNKNKKERSYNVVIFLEGASKEIDREILSKIILVSKKFKNLIFYVKPHPGLPIKKLNLILPNNFITIEKKKFPQIAVNTKIAISYGNTSATLESLAYGCRLIVPTKNIFDKKVMTDLNISDNLYRLCDTEISIYNSIKFFLRIKKNKNHINTKICKALFNKINKKNLLTIL